MKINKAIELATLLRDNQLPQDLMIAWLNEIEGRIHSEVMLFYPSEFVPYRIEDTGMELFVKPPFDDIYVKYLAMKIDMAYKETDNYMVSKDEFETRLRQFKKNIMDVYNPIEVLKHTDYGELEGK